MMNKKILEIMFIPCGMLFCGFILIFLHNYTISNNVFSYNFSFIPWLIFEILLGFIIEFIIIKNKNNINVWLFPCAFFLSNFGIILMGRLEPTLIVPQIRWIIVGMIAFFIFLYSEKFIKLLLNQKYFIGILWIITLIFTLLFIEKSNEISNTVFALGIRLQPLEFIKILFVFFLTSYLSNYIKINQINRPKNIFIKLIEIKFFPLFFITFLASILLFTITKDFGNSLLIFMLAVIMTYIKTGNKLYFFIPPIIFIIGLIISYSTFFDIKIFFNSWLNPWIISSDVAHNIFSSLFAFGSSGIWGAGFTNGNSDFIFYSYSHFIFSSITEEFGLIGAISLMLIYILLFYQSVIIAFNKKDESEILLAFGIGTLFFLNTFITIASCLNIIPQSNTLIPFISYGNSAMISNFILLGILNFLSRKENFDEQH